MEHRWGKRIPVELPLRIDARPNSIVAAVARNVSLSGAYVETAARLLLFARLNVELEWVYWSRAEPYRIPAYAVRSDAGGVALEWCDFAPAPIRAMIAAEAERARGGCRSPEAFDSFPHGTAVARALVSARPPSPTTAERQFAVP